MKLAALLLAPALCFGQFTVAISTFNPAIPRQYLGKPLPKGMVIAFANTCNAGPILDTVYVDRIAQEIATVANVQDGAAAKFAAENAKAGGWKVAGLTILEEVLPLAAGVSLGRAGTALTQGLAAAGGMAVVTEKIKDRRTALSTLSLPGNWWTPNPVSTATLLPGQCYPMDLALDGPPKKNMVTIPATGKQSLQVQPAALKEPLIAPALLKSEAQTFNSVTVTHPQVDDDYGPERVARLIRAHTAEREAANAVGAVQ